MIFSSLTFLQGFLPLCLLLYFLVPRQGKNLVLLLASLLFLAPAAALGVRRLLAAR